jgi:heme A synthase
MQKATAIADAERGDSRAFAARLRPNLQFQHVALFAVLCTYGLVVLGGVVRATDSGTACPDWPLCHGRVIPPLETKVLIEFSHRLVASIVGFLILGTVFWAWRRHRHNRAMMTAAAAALALLAVQVIVGGVTVGTETAASVVAVHLSIALTLLASLIVIAVAAFRQSHPSSLESSGRLPALAVLTVLATFGLIVTGVYVSKTGAGLVYADWPLFDGRVVSAGGRLADLHYAHRLTAAGVGLLLGALVFRALRTERSALAVFALTAAFVLYVAQVFVGASNIWFELPTSLRVVHLALASALWATLVFGLAWRYLRVPVEAAP